VATFGYHSPWVVNPAPYSQRKPRRRPLRVACKALQADRWPRWRAYVSRMPPEAHDWVQRVISGSPLVDAPTPGDYSVATLMVGRRLLECAP
jgi:hypothetical protein